ncbi:MAG: helix-turn-helix domain-containing protein [Patescibacteria group bacterium]
MRSKSIGEILKDYREYHKVSLEDLAAKTHIREGYLELLENNQFEMLPAATYTKGYIRTYAQIFAFDEKPILALLRRDYKESAKGKLIPQEFIKPVLKKRQWWTPITFALLILSSLFIALISYIAVQWYNLQKPPFLEISKPQEDERVAAKVIVEGKSVNDATLLINTQSVELDVNGNFQTEVYLPREGLNTITIEATDRRGKTNVIQRTVRVEF